MSTSRSLFSSIASASALILANVAGCAPTDPCGGEPRLACASQLIAKDKFDEAYASLLPMANEGNSEAQLGIALIVANGHGEAAAKGADLPTRQRLAYPWIVKAAKQGESQAISWLADGYKFGWFGFAVNAEIEQCLRQVVKQRVGSVDACQKSKG